MLLDNVRSDNPPSRLDTLPVHQLAQDDLLFTGILDAVPILGGEGFAILLFLSSNSNRASGNATRKIGSAENVSSAFRVKVA